MQSSGASSTSLLQGLSDLSLYVHLPWCIRKCPYCDFNSHEIKGEVPHEVYLDALTRDLQASLPQVWGRTVRTVFIGGGTPNVFGPQAIDRLLTTLRGLLRLSADCEITMEANPGAGRFAQEARDWQGYRQAGVTRLSLGVQSFDEQSLKAIGRVHDANDSFEATQDASKVFDRLNIDLMYGLPGQSLEMAMRDLETALSFGLGHLSLYQLTLEPNTLFASRPPVLPADEVLEDMHDHLLSRLEMSELDRYEVSAFAREGHVCLHNTNYWRFGDYLGIGAGAHSKLSLPDLGVIRQTCTRHPGDYLKAVIAADGSHRRQEAVPYDRLGFEFMLNTMRLVHGVEFDLFERATGLSPQQITGGLLEAQRRGLMDCSQGRWAPTRLGLDFLNDLQTLFLPQ
ncbi:MAG: radical SAM family heme chaperone HemW [Burkholderiaceae bacterium]